MPFFIIDQGHAIQRHYERKPAAQPTDGVTPVAATKNLRSNHEPPSKFPENPAKAVNASTQQGQSGSTNKKPEANPYQQNESFKTVQLASEIMAHPAVTILTSRTAKDAWRLMEQHRIRHLPVMTQDVLVGMITERDILRWLASNQPIETGVDKVMQTRVFAATTNTDIHQLAFWMFDEKLGAIPIVNEEKNVLGIVTRYDLLKVMSHYGPLQVWA